MLHWIDLIPLSAVIGGLLIGAGAIWLYATLGRIAGISGIFFGALVRHPERWRWYFFAGLLIGSFAAFHYFPYEPLNTRAPISHTTLILSGLLVGFGTRMANGCTSGHGVCGLGRRSPRSLVAVLAFMAAGMVTATVIHSLIP